MDEFRMMQVLTGSVTAAFLGLRVIPLFRPYARRLTLVLLILYGLGAAGIVLNHFLEQTRGG